VFQQRTETTAAGEPNEPASGFTCPRCGGVLWELAAPDELAFQCRIGHRLSLAAMLAEHGAQRRQAVAAARRHLAEAAALNRRIARWARDRGHGRAAAQLEDEALALEGASANLGPIETAQLTP
jgi:two-component system, chemotaxis family, protein-glutamate methylesterase/glutaminase